MAVVELRSRVMASELHVVLVDPRPGQVAAATEHLRHLESVWSRFLPESDISRLNLADGAPTTVDPATSTLVTTMIRAWLDTDGRYDPTILPDLVAAGYGSSYADPSSRTVLPPGGHARRRTVGLGPVRPDLIQVEGTTVTLPIGMALDPGGIGKGLAADLAANRLVEAGAAGALVDLGGDLAMVGRPPDRAGWFVAVERPAVPDDILCTLAIDSGGVATSSTLSRRWSSEGEDRHHLIDPTTGRCADTDLAAVTVIASKAWHAEAYATAALLAGRVGVMDLLDGAGLDGLAVTLEGEVLLTRHLAALDLGGRP
jgi:thiamine biosynthesis lipoprotein